MRIPSRTITRTSAAACLFAVICIAGCTGAADQGKVDPEPQSSSSLPPALRQEKAATPAGGKQTAKANATAQPAVQKPNPDMPTIPPGAQWTIYCQTVSGPGHVDRVNRFKEQLIAQSRMKDWYVIHQDGQSTLYYGFYKDFSEAKSPESQRAQRDRKAIDGLTDRLGNRPFKFAFFVALDAPDPVAPPEWNLANAQGDISLQIAAYTGHPLRKQAAVEAVREARARGLDAYYFHGESTSSVCLGSFPESAVKKRVEIVGATNDPEQTFIKPGIPMPDEAARNQRDAQGKQVRVEQEKFEVADANLMALMKQFPDHAVNGEVKMSTFQDSQTGKRISKPAESFLVPIPKGMASPLTDGGLAGDPATERVGGLPEDRPIAPPSQQPGMGQLRGVQPR